jgi:hypothetical protein
VCKKYGTGGHLPINVTRRVRQQGTPKANRGNLPKTWWAIPCTHAMGLHFLFELEFQIEPVGQFGQPTGADGRAPSRHKAARRTAQRLRTLWRSRFLHPSAAHRTSRPARSGPAAVAVSRCDASKTLTSPHLNSPHIPTELLFKKIGSN